MNPTWLQSSAKPSTIASNIAKPDSSISFSFTTKPCDDKQTSGINQVTKYCSNRNWHFAVQRESILPNGWLLSVFIRPQQHQSFNIKSAASGLADVLVKYADFSRVDFKVHPRPCQLAESLVLDQSVCQDPCIETRNPQCMMPATPVASGTNSEIQNSGGQ
jgi:hypothetical protein